MCGVSGYWDRCIPNVREAKELCDGLDNNCDGKIDEDCLAPVCDTLKPKAAFAIVQANTQDDIIIQIQLRDNTPELQWKEVQSLTVTPSGASLRDIQRPKPGSTEPLSLRLVGASGTDWTLTLRALVSAQTTPTSECPLVANFSRKDIPCEAGLAMCSSGCVQLSQTPAHCGKCELACAKGARCKGGVCASCDANAAWCSVNGAPRCVVVVDNPAHCGACGNVCAANEFCKGAQCQRCEQDSTARIQLCGQGCVDTQTSAIHCGGCDNRCQKDFACMAGACSCRANEDCLKGQLCRGGTCLTCPDPNKPCDQMRAIASHQDGKHVFMRLLATEKGGFFVAGALPSQATLPPYTLRHISAMDGFFGFYQEGWRWAKSITTPGSVFIWDAISDGTHLYAMLQHREALTFFGDKTSKVFPRASGVFQHVRLVSLSRDGALHGSTTIELGVSSFYARKLAPAPNGGALLIISTFGVKAVACGGKPLTIAGLRDEAGQLIVISIDAGGQCRWGSAITSPAGGILPRGVTRTSANLVSMVLQLPGRATIGKEQTRLQTRGYYALVTLDATGAFQLVKEFGHKDVYVSAVARAKSGHLYMGGNFSGALEMDEHKITAAVGGPGTFFAKVSPQGKALWLKQSKGGTMSLLDDGMIVDDKERLFVGGHFSGSVTVGGRTLQGQSAAFLLQMSPAGEVLWSESAGARMDRLVLGASGQLHVSLILNATTSILLNNRPYATLPSGNVLWSLTP